MHWRALEVEQSRWRREFGELKDRNLEMTYEEEERTKYKKMEELYENYQTILERTI